jgi:hypothetical protein
MRYPTGDAVQAVARLSPLPSTAMITREVRR